MSNFSDLVLFDGLPTPVSRTFSAKAQIDGRWTWWYQLASGIAQAFPSLTSKTLFAKGANGATKHEFVLRIPVVDTSVAGSPRFSHFHQVIMTITTSDKGTDAELADLVAYTKNFVASTRFNEIVRERAPPV